MFRKLAFPSKYVQGAGILKELGDLLTGFGSRPILIADSIAFEKSGKYIKKNLGFLKKVKIKKFQGEVTKSKVNNISKKIFDSNSIDFVIGFGGGKTIDLAKTVSDRCKLPSAMIPTSVATNAACSAVAVLYKKNGIFDEVCRFPKHPDLVVVDSQIIAEAPIRLFVSGMGDALAAKFEAEACFKSKAKTAAGGFTSNSAISWARTCYNTIIEQGAIAMIAVKKKKVSISVENVIEAILVQSSIGFESGGTALAHAITNAITNLKRAPKLLHGEKVAFSTIVQLIVENRSISEIQNVIEFCRNVGLPTKLSDIGLDLKDALSLDQVSEAACLENNTANMPFDVDSTAIINGLKSIELF
jgi:glycerol dehydrogenase